MKTYLLIIVIIIIIIIFGYFAYQKVYQNSPKITIPPTIYTVKPVVMPSTKYPLTEQAIMLTFPNESYTTPYSREIYNNLLNKNINRDILKTYKSSPFNINCYVLHTPVFLPNPVKRQGGYFDQETNSVINNLDENTSYYDIIGAYFFQNFNKFLNDDSYQPSYYDVSKRIVIDSESLVTIFNNLRANSNYNQSNFFSKGEMPMLLDDFVPKITMFLFYGLGVNVSSKYIYQNLIKDC